jgi:hypothetical protein
MSSCEVSVAKLVENYNIVEELAKFVEHVLIKVRIRTLWGLSNIAGSEMYRALITNKSLMEKLFRGVKSPSI